MAKKTGESNGNAKTPKAASGTSKRTYSICGGVLVLLVALYIPHRFLEQDFSAAGFKYRELQSWADTEYDFQVRFTQLGLLVVAVLLLRFFLRTYLRMFVFVLFISLGVAVPTVLKLPGVAEKLMRAVAKSGGLPDEVFDYFKPVDDRAWFDLMTKGNQGIGEAYMHGMAKVDPLPLFLTMLNGTTIGTRRKQTNDLLSIFNDVVGLPIALVANVINQQTMSLSKRVTEVHYDAGNDLYEAMLGPSMSYTCAYWKGAKNLDEAQYAKFNLIYRKLELPEGQKMKIADLGMGWGTLAAYVHEQAAGFADVTGVSLSKEQVKWAQEHKTKPGLRFIWQDYRAHCQDPANHGVYDRVYSVGMLEHVGWKNYKLFFRCLKALVKPDGLVVIHTIGEPDYVPVSDAFLDRYIFPGAVIPTLSALTPAFEVDFILEDFQNFGYDYAPTLAAWDVKSKKFFLDNPDAYTPEFQRMWEYYLKMCEALFRLRINQLWHFVFSPRPTNRMGIERQV